MDNKEKLNKAIERDINKNKYYNNIRKRIDKKFNTKYGFAKWYLVPICLVVLISIITLNIGGINKELKTNNNYIKINTLPSSSKITGSDIDLSYGYNENGNIIDVLGSDIELNYAKLINEQPFLKNMKVPKEFINHHFVRQYDYSGKFTGYNLYYWNYTIETDCDKDNFIYKTIEMHFSEDLDFNFDENLKKDLLKLKYSSINNTKVAVWQSPDQEYYYVLFKYNDLYFEMRTLRVSKEDLLNILSSLINNKSEISNDNPFQNNTSTIDTDSREIIKFRLINKKDNLEQIVDKIKNSFDKSFNINDYSLSTTKGPDGLIYDFNFIYGDVKTLHGYTAIIEDNTIEIYNNMGDIKEKVKNANNDNHIIDINDQKKVKEYADGLIEKYSNERIKASLDSIEKIYDDDLNKVVLHINIKIYDKETKTTAIKTETI